MKIGSRKSHCLVIGLVAGLILISLIAVGLVVGARAFSPTTTIEHKEVVGPAGAEAAAVTIEMPSGVLDLSNGTDALLDAGFYYSDPQARPRIQYEREGENGSLLVQQPEQKKVGLRRTVNRWQLRLNPRMPLALMVNAGDGVHSLDLRGLALHNAEIVFPNRGVMTVNLGGYWPEDVDVTLRGGAGLLVVTLPQGMGARVELEEPGGKVTAEDLNRLEGDAGIYVNDVYRESRSTVNVRVLDHRGEITLRNGVPGDLPVREALKLARLIYSRDGTFDCTETPDDGRYLPTDTVNDLWYDYLCERGPEHRAFDGDDPLTQELAAAELVDRIRRNYYQTEDDITGATMKFNAGEFLSATLDMLLKARSRPENVEFSLTHFMGSFTYSVKRVGDRLHFTIENQTDLASGTHVPLRFPDAGYTHSLEALVAQEPHLADAFLLELVQSNRYPIISILEAKSRQETRDAADEGGGNMQQTFTWSEPYLSDFEELPPWPDYVRQLEIR